MDPAAFAFVRAALALKSVPRRGWTRASPPRVESVADHTFGVAVLALAAAEGRRDLDRARLLETALVHDLAEAAVGDLLPGEYADREEKLRWEREGLDRLLASSPRPLAARVRARFEEYASASTPEAQLVRDLDKVEMALQARRYEEEGVPGERLAEFVASAKTAVKDASLRRSIP